MSLKQKEKCDSRKKKWLELLNPNTQFIQYTSHQILVEWWEWKPDGSV